MRCAFQLEIFASDVKVGMFITITDAVCKVVESEAVGGKQKIKGVGVHADGDRMFLDTGKKVFTTHTVDITKYEWLEDTAESDDIDDDPVFILKDPSGKIRKDELNFKNATKVFNDDIAHLQMYEKCKVEIAKGTNPFVNVVTVDGKEKLVDVFWKDEKYRDWLAKQ